MDRDFRNQGWYKKEGSLNDNSNENLFSCVAQSLFSGKHTTTYKYCFLESLLENLYSFDDEFSIAFDEIGETFVSIYWNMIVVYKIPQMSDYSTGERSIFEKITDEMIKDKPYLSGVHYDSIKDEDRIEFLKKAIPEFSKNVIGAFYKDTNGMIFGFSKKEKKIWLNKKSFIFLSENKAIIEQVNYYQWLKMIDGILKNNNKTIENLSTVLECITQRNDLSKFKKNLENLGEEKICFYCGKKLNKSYHLDHVIPWSFLKNDNLWNFVCSCPTCNSSKNNLIPDEFYLIKLTERNKKYKITSPDVFEVAKAAKLNGVKCNWRPKKYEN